MFEFVKKSFFAGLTIFFKFNGCKFIELHFNEQSRMWGKTTTVNSDEPAFFGFSIKTCKCSGSYKSIIDP